MISRIRIFSNYDICYDKIVAFLPIQAFFFMLLFNDLTKMIKNPKNHLTRG